MAEILAEMLQMALEIALIWGVFDVLKLLDR